MLHSYSNTYSVRQHNMRARGETKTPNRRSDDAGPPLASA